MQLRLLISLALAFLIVYVTVPYLRRLAQNLHWLDEANSERKVHTDSIPLVGGPAMAIGILLAVLLNFPGSGLVTGFTFSVLLGGGVLLITGMADDKLDLPPQIKLGIQACCAYFLCLRGIYFQEVFALLGMGGLPDLLQQILSFLFIVGVVNAYNLIDGIDGLAGSLFMAGFAWLGGASLYLGHLDIALVSGVTLSATAAFLRYNTSAKQKIFMGDGGSLFLGFILAGASIAFLERGATDARAALWLIGSCSVLALPVLDELRVFAERIADGKSPMYADRSHIHHILLQIDPAHRSVRHWILQIVFAVFLLAMLTSFWLGVWGGVGVILLSLLGVFAILQLQRGMHRHRESLRMLERRNSGPGNSKSAF
ncbi:UDP-GlcNAc:undecaprenyl-phosphate GlcNAc-1-phosphate transferase [Neolewinella xylanilytica]|uniref:UDP-GlcNAc:undecaprenyl-phosphate GlcNAc-1-phosphate transferase n=1 Tax=Neolewinella xylanilytica TaxID=1514080 RepID=A0A2S6I8L6_9BACT|nr:MraY family glycosyltransferase [Neolewinella xylanilytica]PPK87831.1 UDP-GlcNAc:undecaprenyl-phosphate GlcNAc-1-phosphate transferase [Neolewinella xylanilytica]